MAEAIHWLLWLMFDPIGLCVFFVGNTLFFVTLIILVEATPDIARRLRAAIARRPR